MTFALETFALSASWTYANSRREEYEQLNYRKWRQLLLGTDLKSNFWLLFKCAEYWDWTKWTQSVSQSVFKPAHQFSSGEFVQFSGKSLQQIYCQIYASQPLQLVCVYLERKSTQQIEKSRKHNRLINFRINILIEKWLIIVLETGVWSKVIRVYSPSWSKNLVNKLIQWDRRKLLIRFWTWGYVLLFGFLLKVATVSKLRNYGVWTLIYLKTWSKLSHQ